METKPSWLNVPYQSLTVGYLKCFYFLIYIYKLESWSKYCSIIFYVTHSAIYQNHFLFCYNMSSIRAEIFFSFVDTSQVFRTASNKQKLFLLNVCMSHYFFWFTGITEFKNMTGFTALDWYYQMTTKKTRLRSPLTSLEDLCISPFLLKTPGSANSNIYCYMFNICCFSNFSISKIRMCTRWSNLVLFFCFFPFVLLYKIMICF